MTDFYCDICDKPHDSADKAAACCSQKGPEPESPPGPEQAIATEPKSSAVSVGDRFSYRSYGYKADMVFEVVRAYDDGSFVAHDVNERISRTRLVKPVAYCWGPPTLTNPRSAELFTWHQRATPLQ